MKNILNKATVWMLVGGSVLVASCDKDDTGELSGPLPTASFTASAPKTVGFKSEVTFTSTSSNAFLASWDFGDGTRGTGQTVTHTYQTGGAVKATLTAAGPGGYAVSESKTINLPEVSTIVKGYLTGTTSKTWMLDNAVDAPIVVGTDSNPSAYFAGVKAGELPGCQSDDEYTFSADNTFTYNAKDQTYSAAKGYSCSAPESGTSPFVFGPAVGTGFAQFKLTREGAFIAATDASPTERVYRILSIDANHMTLRAGSPAGTVFDIKMVAK